jgi:hypothetical protein
MGAGLSVDGRTVTGDELEKLLTETMTLTPRPFRAAHAAINGRKNAMDIIITIVENRKQ